MPLFKLLAGGHVTKDDKGKPFYAKKGETVESESDLVEMFGRDKFARIRDEEDDSPKKKIRKEKKEVLVGTIDDGDEEEYRPRKKKFKSKRDED